MSENNIDHRDQEDSGYPLPPATFEFLTLSLKTQTELTLGLLHFGEEKDRPRPDLRASRHTIDLLAMLQEKTKGNLSFEEQRLIDNALTELRFRFVQAVEDSKKMPKQEPKTQKPETQEPEPDTQEPKTQA
ncbi:MAG TPA: DUF1844 domain-containing protein [Bryobacteraceae bacterium]|nr:DUF1844 domain-containing protein [Bryobacteraceae bacterium]